MHCRNCGTTTPAVTDTGHCPDCAAEACGNGAGTLAGLPVPDDIARAAVWLADHMPNGTACGDTACLVCALADGRCAECGEHPTEDDTDHVVVAGTVVIGCDWYAHAVIRAAALAERGVAA